MAFHLIWRKRCEHYDILQILVLAEYCGNNKVARASVSEPLSSNGVRWTYSSSAPRHTSDWRETMLAADR